MQGGRAERGLVAATVNFAFITLTPSVDAAIGAGSVVNSTGNVAVYAGTDQIASSQVLGISVGVVSVAASDAHADVNPTVSASAGGQIDAAGNITVAAGHNVDPVTLLPVADLLSNNGNLSDAFARADAPSAGAIAVGVSLAEADSTANVAASASSRCTRSGNTVS